MSDFRFHNLYQCIICTNSHCAPVSKYSDETAPIPLERGFVETASHHAIHLGVKSLFFAKATSTFLHTNYYYFLKIYYYSNVPWKAKTRVHLYWNITPERKKASSNTYVRQPSKKVLIYRPYNGTGNTVPFPFRSRLISVQLPFLSVFKPFLFCPKSSSSVLVNSPDSEIKCAWSLIAQEGSRQFSDCDRARAYMLFRRKTYRHDPQSLLINLITIIRH